MCAVAVDDGFCFHELLAGGHQVIAVQPGPAVVLGVGQLQVLCLQLQRHLDDLVHMGQVVAVQHTVHHHGPVVLLDGASDFLLQIEGAGMAQKVVEFTGAVLKRELNMIQPCLLQTRGSGICQANARGDEVGVEAQAARFLHQLLQIVAQQRLAARKANLRSAHGTGLAHHINPFSSAQLTARVCIACGVVAKNAVQRAAICQLGQQPQRWLDVIRSSHGACPHQSVPAPARRCPEY